jgi:oligopeptide/dipeptide ABC transporter ATP-binding protein
VTDSLLAVRDLRVDFTLPGTRPRWLGGRAPVLHAVGGVDLDVARGEIVGVVGESGCGKSTLARAITGLVPATAGTITFDGALLGPRRTRAERRRVQMVFQDPGSSLNPAMKVGTMLSELLRFHQLVPAARVRDRAAELLALVELPASVLDVVPRRLSGGQRQRVGIARALAVEPDLLIADEAVSALDVSVQAAVLNLLHDLRRQLDLTMIFISHDLAVVRHLCDRVTVMYLGRVVECGPTASVLVAPGHPYTEALVQVAPRLNGPSLGAAAALAGEPPSPLELPAGCPFHPRCPKATSECRSSTPPISTRGPHTAACHHAWQDEAARTFGTGQPVQ